MLTYFIDLFRKRFLFLRGLNEDNIIITPYRDWLALILAMVAVCAAFIFLAFSLFFVINNDEGASIGMTGTGSLELVHEEDLRKALEGFSEKEKTYQRLIETPTKIIDPSL